MIGNMGGKPQQRKWGTHKRKGRMIRMMKDLMRSRGTIIKNGTGNMPSPSTVEVQEIVPIAREKRKGKGKEPVGGVCKNTKAHKEHQLL